MGQSPNADSLIGQSPKPDRLLDLSEPDILFGQSPKSPKPDILISQSPKSDSLRDHTGPDILFLWVIFALLDKDLDYRSASTALIESGSHPDPKQ